MRAPGNQGIGTSEVAVTIPGIAQKGVDVAHGDVV